MASISDWGRWETGVVEDMVKERSFGASWRAESGFNATIPGTELRDSATRAASTTD